MRRLLLPLLAAAVAVPAWAGSAAACTIDGTPSAYANGVRAVIAPGAPTAATYAWWAHFAFPIAFRVGQTVRFREDDAVLRTVLRPEWLRHPWRWRFGEGRPAVGDSAAHAYTRAGHYRLYVEAEVPGYGYQPFDTITVTVRR